MIENDKRAGESNFVLKNWHVVTWILVNVVMIALSYGETRQQIQDHNRRLDILEQRQPITYEQMKDAMKPFDERLSRIENYIDKHTR